MTAKDKTGDRLVASIRRTRADAEKPVEETSRHSAVPRKARTPARKGAADQANNRAGKQQNSVQANYQSGGRVWPD